MIIKLPIYIITANRNSHKLHLLWDIYLQVLTSKSIHGSTTSWRSGVFCSKKLEKRILYWYDDTSSIHDYFKNRDVTSESTEGL